MATIARRTITALVTALIAIAAGPAAAQTTSTDVDTVRVNIDIRPQNIDATNQLYTVNVEDCELFAADVNEDYAFSWEFRQTPPGDAQYTLKIIAGTETCDTDSLSQQPTDECAVPSDYRQQQLNSDVVVIDLTWQEITGDGPSADCENRTDIHDVSLIFSAFIQDPEIAGEELELDQVRFQFDTRRPTAPTGVTAAAGEATIRVDWDEVGGADSYDVFYSTDVLSTGDQPEDLVVLMANTSSTGITLRDAVSADQTYYVGVSALDQWNNPSLLSEVVTVSTQQVTDFYELYREMGGADTGCVSASSTSASSIAGLGLLALVLILLRPRREPR